MDGYTRLSALMGDQPQYAIFRRFMTLRALRLVHLSADIAQLSDELGLAIENDRNSGDPERVMFEFYYLRLQQSMQNPVASAQAHIWHKLDEKLKEHGEALIMYRSLLNLPDANHQHLETLHKWIDNDRGGHSFFHGAEAFLWDATHRADMTSVSVRDTDEKDAFTSFIKGAVVPFYHSLVGQRYSSPLRVRDPFTGVEQTMPIRTYSDRLIMALIRTISTTVVSLAPALSSLALYFIKDPLDRMSAIVGLTFVCSLVLTIFTRATRVECFAVGAAFSAVLVVFVGNNGPTSGGYSQH